MPPSIYIQGVTVVDYGYLEHSTGLLIGNSFTINAAISGATDSTGVVADFGSVKKAIKECVDGKNPAVTGLDHALVVHEEDVVFLDDTYAAISAGGTRIKMPRSRLFILPEGCEESEADSDKLCERLQRIISYALSLNIELYTDTLFPDCRSDFSSASFSYIHGLQASVSTGCQNIAHGHRSCVLVEECEESDVMAARIAAYLDNSILCKASSLVSPGTIKYTSACGDEFVLEPSKNRIIALPEHPTAENILAHIVAAKDTLFSGLDIADCPSIFLSEGLGKYSFVIWPFGPKPEDA